MERDFYNEDIEQLIKQKADQYKMYPSDKVWKGIHRSLHPRRKWYWFSFVLFLGALSYYTILDMITPSGKTTVADSKNPSTQTSNSNSQQDKQAVVIPFVTTGKNQDAKVAAPAKKHPGIFADVQPAGNDQVFPVTADNNPAENNQVAPAREARLFTFSTGRIREELAATIPERTAETDQHSTARISEPVADPSAGADLTAKDELLNSEDSKRVSWLQQNAVYELKAQKAERLSWQLSFSPTMNYRKLKGSPYNGYNSDFKNLPIATSIEGNPDDLVRHKPALGLEIGSHFIYALNKTFAVKAGFQFNYSRYDIQAFSSNVTDVATIALNRSAGGDSITNYSNIRNFGGDATQELRNQYFQFSIPVGIEWRLLGNDKLQIGIAGTLQPTYLINRNTYLITTDFKNYTQEPSLLRKWNLHTSAEAFIAYKTGDLKWTVGPQFRYQLFSSYIKEYPITEHLMEFGIKIGVAKTIR